MPENNSFLFTFDRLRKKLGNPNEENKQKSINDILNDKVLEKNLENMSKTIEENMALINEGIKNMNVTSFKNKPSDENINIDNSTPGKNIESKENLNKIKDTTLISAEFSVDTQVEEEKKTTKLLDRPKIRVLKENLLKRVFGQDPVLDEVVDILKVAALNIKINKEKPAGNYLFAGPSGVGKTELAQTLADSLDVPLLVINMGEYGLEQDVTKLIGTSPGYVGYQEGGILTNFVMENPVCIVLFDEIEKAHPSIDKILLSIMDKGTATDNKGKKVIFKETIVISTSNLGADIEYIQGLEQSEKNKYRMEAIKEGLRPEIINRYDSVFHFYSLSPEIYKKVVNKFLAKLTTSIQEEHNILLKFSDKILDFISDKSFDPAMGGRPARRFIEKIVVKPLADYMLREDFEQEIGKHPEITIDLNKENNVCFKGKNRKILGVLENTAELVARIEEGKFTNKKSVSP
ncbi:AAA domain-containing protein [archaeon]|nr:AAA domain-containing protein [archaeon]